MHHGAACACARINANIGELKNAFAMLTSTSNILPSFLLDVFFKNHGY